MRRWWPVVVGLAVLLAAAIFWWWPDERPGGDAGTSAAPVSANEGALPTTLKQSAWNAPIQLRGDRSLSGLVLRDGKPVAGAEVTAVAAHGEDVLSDLPCKCDNHCGQMLLACGCAEASGQLVELVAARTGEGAPLARATSDAQGAFTLTGLESGSLTLFADTPEAVGWVANVATDARDARIVITPGRFIRGKVIDSDEQPAKGALVTAIFAQQSRFFDAVADEKGEFKLGPLPLGTYAVVAMQGGLLPDHQQVRDDDDQPLTLELSTPRSLDGVVVSDGAPVAGATVKLDGMHRKRTVTADAKGEFRIDRLRPGKYELTAEATRGLGAASTFVSKHENRSGVTITLVHGERLSGRVLTEAGAPVGDALVSLRVGDTWRKTQSDAAGEFFFEGVALEETDVYAQKDGLLDARVKGRGGQAGLELRMAPASLLTGQVRSRDGELVLRYTISARAVDGGEERQHAATSKSTDGGFALEVHPGAYELAVVAPPYAPGALSAVAPATGLVVVVTPGAAIRGKVLDADGEPAVKARVLATSDAQRSSATTNLEGRFELLGLAPGTWELVATLRRDFAMAARASGSVTLSEGSTMEVVLRPRPGVPVAGVVISAQGEPVEGASVMGWQHLGDGGFGVEDMSSTVTDARGHFRLPSLQAGPVQLMASLKKGHTSAHGGVIAPDENIVLELEEGITISGRVVGAEGKPITTFKVQDQRVDAADGRFSIAVRERETEVAFDAEGYAQLMRRVMLHEGDNPLGDVVMQRGRPVTGVVRDARTRAPIAGALVDVGLEPDGSRFSLDEERGAATSDAQGRYRLAAVDSSSTHIFASAPGHVSTSQPLQGGTADFSLEPGSTLRVRVVDANGTPAQDAFVMARGKGRGNVVMMPASLSGKYESSELAPGSWFVSARGVSNRRYATAQVTLGETPTELVLREASGGATIELAGVPADASALLFPGALAGPEDVEDSMMSEPIPFTNGSAQNVPPGRWTAVVFRPATKELSLQALEVKASGNAPFTFAPQWRPMPAEFR